MLQNSRIPTDKANRAFSKAAAVWESAILRTRCYFEVQQTFGPGSAQGGPGCQENTEDSWQREGQQLQLSIPGASARGIQALGQSQPQRSGAQAPCSTQDLRPGFASGQLFPLSFRVPGGSQHAQQHPGISVAPGAAQPHGSPWPQPGLAACWVQIKPSSKVPTKQEPLVSG